MRRRQQFSVRCSSRAHSHAINTASASTDCSGDLAIGTIDLRRRDARALGHRRTTARSHDGALLDSLGDEDRERRLRRLPRLRASTTGRTVASSTRTRTAPAPTRLTDVRCAFPPETTVGGLELSRKVYVPASGPGFARFYNQVHNPGRQPRDHHASTPRRGLTGDLGSDSFTAGHRQLRRQRCHVRRRRARHRGVVADDLRRRRLHRARDPVLAHNFDGGATPTGSGVRDRVDCGGARGRQRQTVSASSTRT